MEEVANPIEVVKQAVLSLGWDVFESGDEMFQKSVLFTAKSKFSGYHAHIKKHRDSVLHLELAVEFEGFPELMRSEYLRLLNLINQDTAVGSLCSVEDDDDFLVYRSQFYYDRKKGVDEKVVTRFISDCVQAFDFCLPHIHTFLAEEPVLEFDANDMIQSINLRITPEEVAEMIWAGPIAGHA